MEIQEAGFNKELRRPLPLEEQKDRSLIHGGNFGDFIAVKDGNLIVKDGDDVVLELGKLDNNTYGISGSSANPVGAITMYAGSTAPTGWFVCDGSAVSRTVYKDLFQTIGTTYGVGDSSTTFNLPNLKGKFPVGYKSDDADFDELNHADGGAKTVSLSAAQGGSHSHGNSGTASANHTHYYGSKEFDDMDGGSYITGLRPLDLSSDGNKNSSEMSADHYHAVSTTSGSGTAHNNLPPYLVLNFIIKY